MTSKIQYMLVGLFVLGLGTALIAGVLWLGSGEVGRSYQYYVVYMTESVSGLSRDAAVKYRGVDVGRIREIGLDPKNLEQVRLLLEIEEGTPIRTDTVATLEVQGLTGLGYINLVGGSQAAPPLTECHGEDYPCIPSRPSVWGRLDRSLGELVDNLIAASKRINTVLSDENQQLLTGTLDNLNRLTGSLANHSAAAGQSIEDLSVTLDNTRRASARLPELVEQIHQAAGALERTAEEFSRTGVTIRDEFVQTGATLREVVNARDRDLQRFTSSALPEAATLVQELREAAGNLRRLSETLERDPSVLVYGRPPQAPGPGE